MQYKQMIGLEVHCQLNTKTKMFSNTPVSYGKDVNTQVGAIDLGLTGTLPCVNKKAVEYAIKVCHALHMDINPVLVFDRKNYYYSDLPKGFQITQQEHPIGRNGYIDIEIDENIKRIEIERLHLEEDTAKQLHHNDFSLIDYNRAGIPLIEIVTKPVISSGKEATLFLNMLRQILIYTHVSTAKMEEGTLRCDVNISLSTYNQLGTRVEIKNLNSIGNVQKSIEYEFQRQIELLENNQKVIQETRRYDEKLHKTITMRLKEENVDYRYYREPNIPSIRLDQQWIDNIQKKLPIMPMELKKIFLETFRLTHKQAEYLINHKDIASFFKQTIQYSSYYENIIHWLLGDVVAYLNKNHMTIEQTKLKPQYFGELISLLKDEIISTKQGKIVLQKMLVEPISPTQVIQEFNFKQITDEDIIIEVANTLLDEHKELVDLYRKGKNNVLGFFVGQIMKKTKGQANPRKTNDVLLRLLKEKV